MVQLKVECRRSAGTDNFPLLLLFVEELQGEPVLPGGVLGLSGVHLGVDGGIVTVGDLEFLIAGINHAERELPTGNAACKVNEVLLGSGSAEQSGGG